MKKNEGKEVVHVFMTTYFREKFVRMCLESALAMNTTDKYDVRFFIVDNKSDDSLRRYLKSVEKERENVFLSLLPENIGKAPAVMKAASKYKYFDWFINLDSDIVIKTERWVEKLVDSFKAIDGAGMVSLMYEDTGNNPMPKQPEKLRFNLPDKTSGIFRWGYAVAGGCFVTSNWIWAHTGYRNKGTYGGVDGIFRETVAKVHKKKCGYVDCVIGDHLNDKREYPEYFDWKIGVQEKLRTCGMFAPPEIIGNDKGFFDGKK